MKKFLFAIMALLAVNLGSAQNYDKSYVSHKQKLVDGKWAAKDLAYGAYVKLNVDTKTIHIHDDYGIHLDVVLENPDAEIETKKFGEWERKLLTVVVEKDYDGLLAKGTRITMAIWNSEVLDRFAYSFTTTRYGEVLYTVYKHESVYDGVVEYNDEFKID